MSTKFNHVAILATLVPEQNTYGTHYVGRTLYANINQETVLKASLFRGDSIGYIGLSLAIINKRFGPVDNVVILFPVYTTKSEHSVHKMLHRCMMPPDLLQWDAPLSAEELTDIRQQVNEYINTFNVQPDVESDMS